MKAFLLVLLIVFAIPALAAPVIVDGRTVFEVRRGMGVTSVEQRALDIAARIVTGAEQKSSAGLTQALSEGSILILSGTTPITAVTQADADAESMTIPALAALRSKQIGTAIQQYQNDHSVEQWLRRGAMLLLAWLLFGGLLAGASQFLRILRENVSHVISPAFDSAPEGRVRAFIEPQVRGLVLAAFRLATLAVLVFAFSTAISFSLSLFPATASITSSLLDHLWRAASHAGLALVEYLPEFGFLIVLAIIVYAIIKVLRFLARGVEREIFVIPGFHSEWAKPTYDLAVVLILLFSLVVAFPYFPGGDSPALRGVSIFLGVLVSLGSGSAMGNVIAGVILTYMRPFRIGDRVRIADTTGDVVEKGLLVTRVRTIKNETVTVPNSNVLNTHITNYSAMASGEGLVLHTTATLGYDVPWRTVHQLLLEAARRTEGLAQDPKPFVFQTALNDYHVSYELNATTRDARRMMEIYSGLHAAIQDCFNEAGIEIMSPAYQALRDGNTTTIPEANRPSGYSAPSFQIRSDNLRS